MAQKKRKIYVVIIILIFVIYFFTAARPVPRETVLSVKWITTSSGGEAGYNSQNVFPTEEGSDLLTSGVSGTVIPFTLGNRFGYINSEGQFALDQIKNRDIYLSRSFWTEYDAEPSVIIINNINDNKEIIIENAGGYPVLLDNRIFILGPDQNALSEIDAYGYVKWTYEFSAPITSIDAAAGLVVTGSLDGVIEVFNSAGERIFNFSPSGSRFSVIFGAAITRSGSHIGIICGIDPQRFILFERYGDSGGDYRVVYHDFLETGFRHPVRISFIDEDRRVVFERQFQNKQTQTVSLQNGISCYNIQTKKVMHFPLEGEIAAMDETGDNGFFFLVTSHAFQRKKLIGIRFPPDRLFGLSRIDAQDAVFLKASFRSENVFLGRTQVSGSSLLIVGGGNELSAFILEEK